MPDYKQLFYDSQIDLINIEEQLEELLYQVRCAMQRAEEKVIADEYTHGIVEINQKQS